MRKIFISCICILLFISSMLLPVAYAKNSPIGLWQTIDDVTGQPKALIEIQLTKENLLYGRIIKIFPKQGANQHELCTACEGARHNQPIVGMIIMQGLKQSREHPNEWLGGDILDPKNGQSYHCTIRLFADGNQLNVRGYIGLPLFGRSQTWIRVNR